MSVLDLFLAPAAAKPGARTVPPAARAAVLGTPDDAAPLAAALALSLRAADRAPTALVAAWTPTGATVRRDAATRAAARLATRLAADELLSRRPASADPLGADDPLVAHDPFVADDPLSRRPASADSRAPDDPLAADRLFDLRRPPAGHRLGDLTGAAANDPTDHRPTTPGRELVAAPRGRLAWLALPPDPIEAAEAVRRASALTDGPLVTALGGARPARLDELVAEHDLAVVAAEPDSPLARAALARLAGRGVAAVACRPLRRGLPRTLALAGLAAPRLDHVLRYGCEEP